MNKTLIAIVLGLAMITTACTTSMISTILGYVNTFLPIAETITGLVMATENPTSVASIQSVEQKINADLQEIQLLGAGYSTANATTTDQKILAVAKDIQININGILTSTNVVNPTTKLEVEAFVLLGDDLVNDIINSLPVSNSTVSASQVQFRTSTAVSSYKKRYNKLIRTKSGDARVDAVLSSRHKLVTW